MSSTIQLIVGLGNPGAEYESTRHNAGAWFVLELAKECDAVLRYEAKFSGFHTVVRLAGQECHLLIPTTFMNASGQSVKALAQFYKIPVNHILIAHDEIDLPVATVRLKLSGGHGGHNGLRDIIQHFNASEFCRLRIGVGHPGSSREVHDYVLSEPKKTERKAIDEAFVRVREALPMMLKGEFQKAMNALHSEPEK